MGGGGFLGLGPAPSAPAAPDYAGAATATAAGNLDAARAATAANRVNQVTPYGNLNYAITGQDPYGNPTWTATTSLSDVGQQLLNNQNNASLGLGGTINSALGRVQDTMGQGFNPNLPSVGINPGENYSDAVMRRLAPQIAQNDESQKAALANQGIVPGTAAYDNAMRTYNQGKNDLLTSAQINGINTGLQANNQAFGQELTKYNIPLNTLSALRTGAQVQNPTFVNSAQQATTAGPDLLGAAGSQYNAALGASNAANAAQSNFNSGLMGLGGTLGAAAIMSDIRTKEHIKAIGWLPNGLPVYEYEYKSEWKDEAGHGKFIGVMAQEVELVQPEAVITRPDGYKMVNYGVLNG
jgi:Chaperone of endosialidase